MKKSLAVLMILACMLGLVACGSSAPVVVDNPICTPEEAASIGENTVNNMDFIVRSGMTDQYAADEVSYNGLLSWESAMDEIGEFTGIQDIRSEIGSDEVTIDVSVGGTNHDAVVEMILGPEGAKSISTNVKYSMGELMTKAALNTLIGMGTVFAVLILISLIISAFNLIPVIQSKFSRKEKAEEVKIIKEEAVDNTIARIVKQEEDLELVAVITAAIAASEGSAGTDGFVVRSIRKRA